MHLAVLERHVVWGAKFSVTLCSTAQQACCPAPHITAETWGPAWQLPLLRWHGIAARMPKEVLHLWSSTTSPGYGRLLSFLCCSCLEHSYAPASICRFVSEKDPYLKYLGGSFFLFEKVKRQTWTSILSLLNCCPFGPQTSSSSNEGKVQNRFLWEQGEVSLKKKQNQTTPWPQIPLQLIMGKLLEKAAHYFWSQLWRGGGFLLLLISWLKNTHLSLRLFHHMCNQFLALSTLTPVWKT